MLSQIRYISNYAKLHLPYIHDAGLGLQADLICKTQGRNPGIPTGNKPLQTALNAGELVVLGPMGIGPDQSDRIPNVAIQH